MKPYSAFSARCVSQKATIDFYLNEIGDLIDRAAKHTSYWCKYSCSELTGMERLKIKRKLIELGYEVEYVEDEFKGKMMVIKW